MNKVTILVNSCDLYEDAWEPFFKLLHIQWPNCKYPILLNSETKKYECSFMDVKTICTGLNKAWSQRVLESLELIKSEYVLFFLEDQFLREPVNVEQFDKTVAYMDNNPHVGVIFVRHTEKQKTTFEEKYFPRDLVTDNFRIVGLAALYRKEYFKKILRAHENPWEFEHFASIRSKRYRESVLQYNKKHPAMFVFDDAIEKGYGITARKWLPKNKDLFEKYGIDVNFENLGWYNPKSPEVSCVTGTTEKTNSFVEFLYNVKKRIKRCPQRFKENYKMWKSLK